MVFARSCARHPLQVAGGEKTMKVFIVHTSRPVDCNINPADLYAMCQMEKRGDLHVAIIKVYDGHEVILLSLTRLDASKTFERAILDGFRDTDRPPPPSAPPV